jgi:hypothetical protein
LLVIYCLGIDGRIILKWILKNIVGNAWTGFIWLRIGTSGGALVSTAVNIWVA